MNKSCLNREQFDPNRSFFLFFLIFFLTILFLYHFFFFVQVSSSPPTPTPNRGCCENGRPVLTDPATGQSVCSCQYSSALLGYSRLSGLSSSLFSPSSYSPGGPPPSGYGVTLGAEGSAFYSPLVSN